MRTAFISYAREDKERAERILGDVQTAGYTAFLDAHSLVGGERWWPTILNFISSCDAFVAVISRASLSSDACRRERQWAVALRKPMLGVAIETLNSALPTELAAMQTVPYSKPDHQSGAQLVAALLNLPPAPPVPAPMPRPPASPVSPLQEARRIIEKPEISKDEQHRALDIIEPGLRSSDSEIRDSAGELLAEFAANPDLLADIDHRILALKRMRIATEPVPPQRKKGSKVARALIVLGVVFLILVVWGLISLLSGGDCYYDYYGRYICN